MKAGSFDSMQCFSAASSTMRMMLAVLLLALPSFSSAMTVAPFQSSSQTPPMSSVLLTPYLHSLRAIDRASGRLNAEAATSSLGTFLPKNLPTAPPCGLSPCDVPETVAVWKERVEQKRKNGTDSGWPVVLRARVYVLSNDDGSAPLSSTEDIVAQFHLMNSSLHASGLAFVHEIVPMRNSTARARVVVPFCDPELIGDGSPCTGMKIQCNVSVTGWAGGDCLPNPLPPPSESPCGDRANDTVCHPECNFAVYHYDGGDCCLPSVAASSCRQPGHPLRAWLTQDFYRALPVLQHQRGNPVPPPDAEHFSIYPVAYPPPEECPLCGASTTMPWSDERRTFRTFRTAASGRSLLLPQLDFNMSNLAAQGSLYSWSSFQGVSSTMGQGSIPLHELGHTLGLLHTFRGMEPLILFPQIPPCALAVQDTCIDGVQYNHTTTAAGSGTRGLLTGDLVDDTPVSPLFVPLEGGACGQQPTGSDCAAVPWAGVPTRNFMGFNYFVCSASELEFSPTQIAKMHCTIDWRYRSWIAQPPRSPPSGQNDDDDDNGKRFGWGDGLAVLIGFLAVGALAFYFIRKRRREAAARQPAGGYHLQV